MAAAGKAPALICDTGAIIDYLDRSAPDHKQFRSVIDNARARYVPGLVLAEVDYFLRGERNAMRASTRASKTLDSALSTLRSWC